MTWIWPGEVCVRSSTPGVVVWKVSHMSRAGMVRRHVEQLEVRLVVLDFAAAVNLEAHVGEDGVDSPQRSAWRCAVGRADAGGPAASRRAAFAVRTVREGLLLRSAASALS